jgi:hypothetical protein
MVIFEISVCRITSIIVLKPTISALAFNGGVAA